MTILKFISTAHVCCFYLLQDVKKIGGVMLENLDDAANATHLIAPTDREALRTPKLMIALCRTPNILHADWLEQSAAAGKALDTEKFLLLNQKKAEKRYDFNMAKALANAKELRSKGELLLTGYDVYVCGGVAGNARQGNKTPNKDDFVAILQGAGANVLASLPSSDLQNPTIIITSKLGVEAKKQLSFKEEANAVSEGAVVKTTEEIFHSFMTQEFDS
jgi:hypothetical protein